VCCYFDDIVSPLTHGLRADPLGTTREPTDAELTTLRTEVDPGRYTLGRAVS
jgi:hypothetical protein